MTRIILDEHDADTLLRILYNGTRPARVHTLICLCSARADLRVSSCAWNGWQILPHPKCPECLAKHRAALIYAPSPELAREEFLRMVDQFTGDRR
jgi:hypothetical protein